MRSPFQNAIKNYFSCETPLSVKKLHLPILVMLFLFACSAESAIEVVRIGELEDLIKKGDMKTKASLNDYSAMPNLYGIGTVTDLKGFIQLINGKSYTAYVEDGQVKIDSSLAGVEATLLLYTQIAEWKEFDIPAEVVTWKQLEQYIGNQAVKYKMPKNKPSPFLLKGTLPSGQWHVVDWNPNDKEVTYKKTTQAGLNGEIKNEPITAVGFYSRQGYQILTHRESRMHIHFVNENHSLAGHLDDFTLDGKVKLYLPKILDRE
jgi:acetolactate decarboxylase